MKLTIRLLSLITVFALALCNARAAVVTFSTSGYFFDAAHSQASGGYGADPMTFGDDQLMYANIVGSGELLTPTHVSLGEFIVVTGGAGDTILDTVPTGAGFVLNVFVPAGSGNTSQTAASFTGSLSYFQNSITATFAPATFQVDGATFKLAAGGVFDLVPAGTNGGRTSIQAGLDMPEPGAAYLFGGGLAAVGLWFKRRKR